MRFFFFLRIHCIKTELSIHEFYDTYLYKMHNFKFNSAHIQFQLITIIHSQYMFIDIFYI